MSIDTSKTIASADARCGAYTQLWMHQNGLVFARLQNLTVVEVAFFAVAYFSRKDFVALTAVLILSMFFLALIWIIIWTDKNFRDSHGEQLRELGVDPIPLDSYSNWSFGGRMTGRRWEDIREVVIVGACITINAVVAIYLSFVE